MEGHLLKGIGSFGVKATQLNASNVTAFLLPSALLSVLIIVFGALSPAQAGEEKQCADQYSLEEQYILEWAALGGDPHAQFSMAQCSFPLETTKLSRPEKLYAAQWVFLARCESLNNKIAHRHNARTRALKENGDLSFRRFTGGEAEGDWSKREKLFQHYRRQRIAELKTRGDQLNDLLSQEERLAAQSAMIDRLSRMGPMGLTRLAQLSDCDYFGADESLRAAAWQTADEAWREAKASGLYGKSDVRGWSYKKESKKRFKQLDETAQSKVAFEKNRLMRASPANLAALEDNAALSALEKLSVELPSSQIAHVTAQDTSTALTANDAGSVVPVNYSPASTILASNSLAPTGAALATNDVNKTPTVALAAQYALEALGMMRFINGPDNDYGPATIAAVEKFQSKNGYERTRWLSHQQIRDAICQAANKKDDPVSLMHLSYM